MSPPQTLLESATWLGRCRYVELTAFGLLGARAADCDDPALVGYLAGASLAHGYRAGLLEALLPVSNGLPGAATCTVSPGGALDEALDACSAPGPDAELLDALCGALYPALEAAYETRRAGCAPAADGALARTLGRLLADLEAVLVEGRSLAENRPASGMRRRRVVELLGSFGSDLGRRAGPP